MIYLCSSQLLIISLNSLYKPIKIVPNANPTVTPPTIEYSSCDQPINPPKDTMQAKKKDSLSILNYSSFAFSHFSILSFSSKGVSTFTMDCTKNTPPPYGPEVEAPPWQIHPLSIICCTFSLNSEISDFHIVLYRIIAERGVKLE